MLNDTCHDTKANKGGPRSLIWKQQAPDLGLGLIATLKDAREAPHAHVLPVPHQRRLVCILVQAHLGFPRVSASHVILMIAQGQGIKWLHYRPQSTTAAMHLDIPCTDSPNQEKSSMYYLFIILVF